MNAPRHISKCIDEWLDGCPFNQPDAIQAAREELDMTEQHAHDGTKGGAA